MFFTKDKTIRTALRNTLNKDIEHYCLNNNANVDIFEEFSVKHGTERIDFAVINGIMHGYEIKSDRDTLKRLPEQVNEFNKVFDKLTLVVGKHHLLNAINIIPDWWGITLAKINSSQIIYFQAIREAEDNPHQKGISIARLLWKQEALEILKNKNQAKGMRSKPREIVYKKLAEVLNLNDLKKQVMDTLLISRGDWKSDKPLVLNGGL